MATVAELLVRIGGDSSGLRREIAASQRQLRRGFGSDALEMSGAAAGLLAGLAAACGLAGAAAIKMSSDFAANKTAFATLLGSADAAEKMLNDLATFAADTPFELPGLIQSAKKLMAFQFAAEDIIPIMASVGDAISLVGGGQEAIDGVVRALGQIQAKGKLSAEEMNQLAERGINGWKYIADEMGISIADVMGLCQQGAIDSTTAINAVVKGMQTNFAGGMDAMSKTVPGLLSTIKDNAGMLLKNIGDQLTTAFDLQGKLQSVADFLTQFTAVVKGAGVKEAIQGLIPPEAIAAVFAISGAIVAAAIPAMYAFALSTWAAIAPLLPFIAAGAAVGALAYEIWNNWEPLCELFSTLWSTISQLFTDYWNVIAEAAGTSVDAVMEFVSSGWNSVSDVTSSVWSGITEYISSAWQSIKQAVADGIQWIVDKMQPLLDLISKAMPEGVKTLFSNLAAGMSKVAAVTSKLHIGGIDVSSITGQGTTKPNTKFTGLHGVNSNTSSKDPDAGKAAKEAEKEWEKLEKKAQQVSDSIEKEWVQTTKSQLEQLDIWKTEQMTALDETAAANENYERDKERINAVYSARRTKILQQEAKEALDTFKTIRDGYMSIQKEITLGSLTGSKKDTASSLFDLADKAQKVTDYFDKISNDYAVANDKQKSNIITTLNSLGIAYQQTDDGRLNFSKATDDAIAAYKKQTWTDLNNYYATCKDVQSNIDAAYAANSMAQLKAALTAENAERMNNYSAQKTMMDTYQASFLAAHQTTAQLVANLYAGAFSGLKTALSDILSGTTSINDAFKTLGQTMLKVVADYVASWIAGRLMMALFGDQSGEKQIGKSTAQGTATALAWAPAAAMVSLATFGANAGPAIEGMAMANLASYAMASIPGLATGGITTGPTIAQIGEGHYQEAVLPLNKKAFEKAGLTSGESGSVNQVSFNISAIDGDSVKKWLKKSGGREISKYFGRQASEFAGVTI